MKAEIRWEDEAHTTIRYTWSGDWNWDDFYAVLDRRFIDLPENNNVYVIADFRDTTRPPSDAILYLKRAAKMAEESDKLIIMITNSTKIVTLYNAFVTMYKSLGKRFRIVTSDEEAHAILGALREKGD